MKRAGALLLLLALALAAAGWWALREPGPSRVDYGRWRVVVLQSDDWGLEAWFPDRATARRLEALARPLPPRLSPYLDSSLAPADQLDSLAKLLAAATDADGLPAVLQANSVVAALDVAGGPSGPPGPVPWALREPASAGSPYARPGYREQVDRLIARGIWWPELHGLTHFDPWAYRDARAGGDPVASRAAAHGVVAWDGWLQAHELAQGDPARARALAREGVRRFERRFGRAPTSTIAPDYRWDAYDEDAWQEQGITVVQAKREQQDPALGDGRRARLRKRVLRSLDGRRRPLLYLDRPARLEPYGQPDPAAPQGADEARARVEEAWARGRPGIVSIHRVQLANLDPAVASAGRSQLRALLEGLGGYRVLVDHEIAQLERRGWSVLDRGPWRVWRNFGDAPLVVEHGGARRELPVGTLVEASGGPTDPAGEQDSR